MQDARDGGTGHGEGSPRVHRVGRAQGPAGAPAHRPQDRQTRHIHGGHREAGETRTASRVYSEAVPALILM